jgi:adenine-specific DNA-methyltransferase
MTYEQIHNLFKQRYNQTNWKQFLGEAFAKSRLLTTPEILTGIDSNVASQVQKLGYITLNENGIERQIAVFEVTLAQGIILERNRVGLRNLLRKYWKDIDAAFIAYHRPESPKWRFTYVSELTGYDADGEFVKIKTEPKRYTYVLGEGESTRTAAERFTAIANKGSKATLDDVKEAFSVEKLSKAFFDEYKKHYDIFCDFMVSKPNIRQTIFNGDEKGIRDFNKKLLGRIVFLYFIQKKGWLGVPAKSDWGKGDFDFLTNLFKNTKNPDLFYSELLSKLFFDTLNTKRKDDLIELVKGEPCRIPYLNGGLFEEDDKKHRNLIFPANLFKSLFDFFNQYNFTIYEDDPNDHTVAVDPEMLGHIFENLLEDNKDKGAYYTPKEIVHYMCQESLIEYLTTWFENKGYEVVGYIGFDKPDQPKLFSANEGRKGQLVMETDNKTIGKQIDRILIEKLLKKKLDDDDKKLIKKHSVEFHNALDSVKICDPAIGSGAFPMGLLHEIFTAKQTLHTFEHGNTKTFDASGVKLNIIQNSIYGVDIEKGAVDIARLRFWLSLIVDEEKPKALSNLDYKIVVGNSLVSKLGDDIIDIDWTLNETSHGLFGADLAKQKGDLLKKISKEQKEFFNPDSDKKKLAADIRNLKIDLLITQLELMISTKGIEKQPTGSGSTIAKQTEIYLQTIGWKSSIKDLQKLKNKPEIPLHFFDWKLDFPEVMNEQVTTNTGFDIVIGNPPYGANIDKDAEYYQKKFIKVAKSYLDIYKCFYEQGYYLLKQNGVLTMITPNTFISQPRYVDLRTFLLNTSVLKINNLGMNVFESAVVPTAIFFGCNSSAFEEFVFIDSSLNSTFGSLNDNSSQHFLKRSEIESSKDLSFLNFKNKHDFSFDDVFEIKDAGIQYHRSGIGLKNKGGNDLYERLFSENKNHFKNNIPTIYGKKINYYYIDTDIDEYFNKSYKEVLKSNESVSFNLEAFSKIPKILWRQTAAKPIATIDYEGYWFRNTIQCCWLRDKYNHVSLEFCLGLINSKFIGFTYNKIVSEAGRVFPQVKIGQVKKLPFVLPEKTLEKYIASRVKKLLAVAAETPNKTFMTEIDIAIYKLYKLTFEEVKVIDPEFILTEKEYEAIKLE